MPEKAAVTLAKLKSFSAKKAADPKKDAVATFLAEAPHLAIFSFLGKIR